MFDSVLLLGVGGRTVFLGPATAAYPYFTKLGFHMPPNDNPADFMMVCMDDKHDFMHLRACMHSDTQDVIGGGIARDGFPDFKPADLFHLWNEHKVSIEPADDEHVTASIEPARGEHMSQSTSVLQPDQPIWAELFDEATQKPYYHNKITGETFARFFLSFFPFPCPHAGVFDGVYGRYGRLEWEWNR